MKILTLSFVVFLFSLANHALANWRISGMSGTGPCTFLSREDAVSFIQNSDYDSGNKQFMLEHIQDCGGGDGNSGGANPGSAGASQAGAAIGQAIVHALFGPSAEEKEQKRQQVLQAQQEEEQREAEAKAEQDREDQEKLDHLKGKLKGIDGSDVDNSGGLKLKSIDGGDEGGTSPSGGPKLKGIDDDSDVSASSITPKIHKPKAAKKGQTIAETDGVTLMKRPVDEHKDKIWIQNNNDYPVDVDVYMSIGTNCNHSFADHTLKPGQSVCAGWVEQNKPEDEWSYTVGLNVSKHNAGGYFNYAP